MNGRNAGWVLSTCAAAALAAAVFSGTADENPEPSPQKESGPEKRLYAVSTAHLDTQWRWTIQDTIRKFIPKTLRQNFERFEAFPSYVFNFEGAFRYMLAKEYYPEEYERLKGYVAQGRWCVAGSMLDAPDVNMPSPESLIRHVLYGNGFFQKEFGKRSRDIFLPDCFGFGYALPSIAAHCGLKGFSTQKLAWGSSVPLPFDVGVWEGVDGSSLVAAINPDAYVAQIKSDPGSDPAWLSKIDRQGERSGVFVGYRYFGVGDQGGAPDKKSIAQLEKGLAGSGPIKVLSASSDRMCQDLKPEQINRLPRYKGEFLLKTHGTGCYTSQAAMKRWNRQNELLADAAERASVGADWLGGAAYPREKLEQAWIRFLWNQMHDGITGTSLPEAYRFAWNDEIVALNQFSAVLADAAGATARALDTRAQGTPVAVFNPLAIEREDAVQARLRFPGVAPKAVRIYDPSGKEVPSQIDGTQGDAVDVTFLARVPSVGWTVYDARPAEAACALKTGVEASESGLENARYKVHLDANGDVSSVWDKQQNRELLAAPLQLQLLEAKPVAWPAWEIAYSTVTTPPREVIGGPAQVRVAEQGPARAALEVSRSAGKSTFVQRIRLAAGSGGDRLEFDTQVDWKFKKTLLKAAFPLAAASPRATYDLGLGTIERGNDSAALYEVPAQQWVDLSAEDGSRGATILNDCKYGWDKPGDDTLRLTLLYTPRAERAYPDQATQDLGHHRFLYGVYGHAGDWRSGGSAWQAARLNQPLLAFQTAAHEGPLGRSFSLLQVSTPQVSVKAVKKAEETDEIVVRFQEMAGKPIADAKLAMAGRIAAAREVNGAEESLGPAKIVDGQLRFDLKPYQPRAFALKIEAPKAKLALPVSKPVELPFDLNGVSLKGQAGGDFDGEGHSLPGELLPSALTSEGISFKLGPTAAGQKNVLSCQGQTIRLEADGRFNRLYLLAAAAGGDAAGTFTAGGKPVELTIQDFTGIVGQWDSRLGDGKPAGPNRIAPGFIKRDPIAWLGTHRHDGDGENEPYVFCYLFKYAIDLPAGAKEIALPKNDKIRIVAMTLASDPDAGTVPAGPLYD